MIGNRFTLMLRVFLEIKAYLTNERIQRNLIHRIAYRIPNQRHSDESIKLEIREKLEMI